MAEEKIYCGSGKSHPSYDIVNIDVCIDKIPEEFIYEDKNGKKWLKLTVSKKREVDQYGKSHTVTVNTWKPNNSSGFNESHGDNPDPLPF